MCYCPNTTACPICCLSGCHSLPISVYLYFLSLSLLLFRSTPLLLLVTLSNASALFSTGFQPLWRFTDSPADGRLLVYRSDDIRNLSRIASPKVCGYVHAEAKDLLPQTARKDWDGQEDVDQEKGELFCLFRSLGLESLENVFVHICACVVELCRRRMEYIQGWSSQIWCSVGSVILFVDGKE